MAARASVQPQAMFEFPVEKGTVFKKYFCHICNKEYEHEFELEVLEMMGLICQTCNQGFIEEIRPGVEVQYQQEPLEANEGPEEELKGYEDDDLAGPFRVADEQ